MAAAAADCFLRGSSDIATTAAGPAPASEQATVAAIATRVALNLAGVGRGNRVVRFSDCITADAAVADQPRVAAPTP